MRECWPKEVRHLSEWKPYIAVILWSITLNNKHDDNYNNDENNKNNNYYYYYYQ